MKRAHAGHDVYPHSLKGHGFSHGHTIDLRKIQGLPTVHHTPISHHASKPRQFKVPVKTPYEPVTAKVASNIVSVKTVAKSSNKPVAITQTPIIPQKIKTDAALAPAMPARSSRQYQQAGPRYMEREFMRRASAVRDSAVQAATALAAPIQQLSRPQFSMQTASAFAGGSQLMTDMVSTERDTSQNIANRLDASANMAIGESSHPIDNLLESGGEDADQSTQVAQDNSYALDPLANLDMDDSFLGAPTKNASRKVLMVGAIVTLVLGMIGASVTLLVLFIN